MHANANSCMHRKVSPRNNAWHLIFDLNFVINFVIHFEMNFVMDFCNEFCYHRLEMYAGLAKPSSAK